METKDFPVLTKDEIIRNLQEKQEHAKQLIQVSRDAGQSGNAEYWTGYVSAAHDAICLVQSLK